MADAQEFVDKVVEQCRERGYETSATALENAKPDTDPTSYGGQGAEKVAEAMATTAYNQVYHEVMDVLQQPVDEKLADAMKIIGTSS